MVARGGEQLTSTTTAALCRKAASWAAQRRMAAVNLAMLRELLSDIVADMDAEAAEGGAVG